MIARTGIEYAILVMAVQIWCDLHMVDTAPATPSRVVVLASGAGSNLQALLDHPPLTGAIARVITDVAGAGALARAEAAGVETRCVDRPQFDDRPTWEDALAEEVADATPHLVVLAGFMRILSAGFVSRWPMLNVHPSLLPSFPGANAVQMALDHGVKVSGVTVHFVTEEVDAGPIVAQEAVLVLPDDDADRLHERMQDVEHRLLPHAVTLFLEGSLEIAGRHVRIAP